MFVYLFVFAPIIFEVFCSSFLMSVAVFVKPSPKKDNKTYLILCLLCVIYMHSLKHYLPAFVIAAII